MKKSDKYLVNLESGDVKYFYKPILLVMIPSKYITDDDQQCARKSAMEATDGEYHVLVVYDPSYDKIDMRVLNGENIPSETYDKIIKKINDED